jgi:hypothetical protein
LSRTPHETRKITIVNNHNNHLLIFYVEMESCGDPMCWLSRPPPDTTLTHTEKRRRSLSKNILPTSAHGLLNRLGYKSRNRGSCARTRNGLLDSLQIISTVHPYFTRSSHLRPGLKQPQLRCRCLGCLQGLVLLYTVCC